MIRQREIISGFINFKEKNSAKLNVMNNFSYIIMN